MEKLLTIIVCAIIGAICFRYAKQRGRSPYIWFGIGLLFGVFGLAALFILPRLPRPTSHLVTQNGRPLPIQNVSSLKQNLELLDPSHTSKLWYYLDEENQQFGPMSLDALTTAWNNGKVNKATYVWNEVMENWRHFEEVLRSPLQSSAH